MLKDKQIYFMGIAGTGMAPAAGLMKEAGYEVIGSDDAIYPPMSDLLSDLNIPVLSPFSAQNISQAESGLFVAGNRLSRGHCELEEVLRLDRPLTSFPALIGERILKDRLSIVVTGTHGKTTTTCLLSHMLDSLGQEPGFLIGGLPKNFPRSFRLGGGELFVIEGDEYDTAYFDKESKFLHYHPDFVLFNNLEFDHADIFDSIEDIEKMFLKLTAKIPDSGVLVANGLDAGVRRFIESTQLNTSRWICVGEAIGESSPEVKLVRTKERRDSWGLQLETLAWGLLDVHGFLPGVHNIANLLQSLGLLSWMHRRKGLPYKFSGDDVVKAIESFEGVKRRMETLLDKDDIRVYEDFAHHPTAVGKVIESFKASGVKGRLVVAFEPKNATSRRNIFQADYEKIFAEADVTLLGACPSDARISDSEKMDTKSLAGSIAGESHAFSENQHLLAWLKENVTRGDVVVFMSCGSFEGIQHDFVNFLKVGKN